MLRNSSRLSDEDLVEIARTKSEQHLLAISGAMVVDGNRHRRVIGAALSAVSRRLVKNPGARVSASGFTIIVSQAESDPELAVDTGIRVDLPPELRNQLLRNATEAVRSRLLSRAPPHLFEEIRNAIASGLGRRRSRNVLVRDFTAAKQFVAILKASGKLNEARLFGFARAEKI